MALRNGGWRRHGGVIESLGVLFSSTEWSDVIAFTFLVLVIWVRPWGLFGVEERS